LNKRYWKEYKSYVLADSREDALEVLERVSADPSHLVRLSVAFSRDWGRLPDHLHNMIVLSGGKSAGEYLANISGKSGT
jgi:hypothetical protein